MSNPAAPLRHRPAAPPRAGWPRPRAPFLNEARHGPEPERLPVPWILRTGVDGEVAWTCFHDGACRAHHERLCQVCGEGLRDTILLGVADDSSPSDPRTSGPGCHPRCMALSIRFCPHLRQIPADEIVAYAHIGKGVGYRLFDADVAVDAPSDVEIMSAYMQSMPVAVGAIPLNRAAVLDMAVRDPDGLDPAAFQFEFGSPGRS